MAYKIRPELGDRNQFDARQRIARAKGFASYSAARRAPRSVREERTKQLAGRDPNYGSASRKRLTRAPGVEHLRSNRNRELLAFLRRNATADRAVTNIEVGLIGERGEDGGEPQRCIVKIAGKGITAQALADRGLGIFEGDAKLMFLEDAAHVAGASYGIEWEVIDLTFVDITAQD